MQPARGVKGDVVARAWAWGLCAIAAMGVMGTGQAEAAMVVSGGTGSVTYVGGDGSFSATGVVPFPPGSLISTGGGGPATTGAMFMGQDFDPPGFPYGVYLAGPTTFLSQTVPPEAPPVGVASLTGIFDVDFVVGPGGNPAELRTMAYFVSWMALGGTVTFDVTITYTLDPDGTPIVLGGQSLSLSETGTGSPGTIISGTSLALPAFAPGDVVNLSGSFLVTVDDDPGGPSTELDAVAVPPPVPTPATGAMAAAGVLLTMWRGRRRK